MQQSPRATELKARYEILMTSEPRLRARDRSSRLQVSEAELIAAQCGVSAIALAGSPQEIFNLLPTLGEVMVLSRNDWCVHERHGRYEEVHAKGPVGMVLGADLDLRMFFSCWKYAFAVTENERRSVQFFDGSGTAIHKVYLTANSDQAAFDALSQQSGTMPEIYPEAAPADTRLPVCEGDHPCFSAAMADVT